MKAVLRDLNDPTKLKIEIVEGHIPENLVTFDLPADIQSQDADCLELETISVNGVIQIRAVLNQTKKDAKKAAELAARDADRVKIERKATLQAKLKNLNAADINSAAKLQPIFLELLEVIGLRD